MKKRLNVDLVQNELRGGSAFFPGYKGSEPEEEHALPSPSPIETAAPAVPVPTRRALPLLDHKLAKVTPAKASRTFIKRTFDLFEDQLNYLTRESLQDRLAGKEGSMNAMVREAIDEWIKKREAAK